MSQTQHCSVCGAAGTLVEGRVHGRGDAADGTLLVARCPRCKRFVCGRHGEWLDLSPQARGAHLARGTVPAAEPTLCCPFDPGVALGDPE